MSEQIGPLNPDLFSLAINGAAQNNPLKNQGLTDFSTEISAILQRQGTDLPRIESIAQPDNVLPDKNRLPVASGNSVHPDMQKFSALHDSEIIGQSFNTSIEDKKVRPAVDRIINTVSIGDLHEAVNVQSSQSLPVNPLMSEGLPIAFTADSPGGDTTSVKELPDPALAENKVSSEPENKVSSESNHELKNSITPSTLKLVTRADVEKKHITIAKDASIVPVMPDSEVKVLDTEDLKSDVQEIKNIPIEHASLVGQQVNKKIDSVLENESLEDSFVVKPNKIVLDLVNGDKENLKVDKENNQLLTRTFHQQIAMEVGNQKKTAIRESTIDSADILEREMKVSNDILNKATQVGLKELRQQADSIQKQLKQYQIFISPDKAIEPMLAEYGITANQSASLPTTNSQVSIISSQPLQLEKPINDPAWGDELGEKIKWISKQQMQSAEIRLNPAHLGSIEVKIQIQNDQATIQITAMNASVKEALEIAIPRLREMMDASGIQLADVEVNEQSNANAERRELGSRHNNKDNNLSNQLANVDSEQDVSEITLVTPVLSDSSVDLFA